MHQNRDPANVSSSSCPYILADIHGEQGGHIMLAGIVFQLGVYVKFSGDAIF